MTRYSTYGLHRYTIDLTALSTDPDTRDEEAAALSAAIAAGFARTLLDAAVDLHDPDRPVRAVEYQTPVEGWELAALDDTSSHTVTTTCTDLLIVADRDLFALAHRIRHQPGDRHDPWARDTGMAFYRIGQLHAQTAIEGAYSATGHPAPVLNAGFSTYATTSPDLLITRLTRIATHLTRNRIGIPYLDSAEPDPHLHLHQS